MASSKAEAEELIRKAEKCLKTSLLKWSPDIDSAIGFYSKAALLYRNSKMPKESAAIYMLIGDLYAKNGSFFHCAKSYDTASLLFRDSGDFDKVVECVQTAGKLLRQNGVPDSAESVYARGAKSLEGKLPEQSAKFYENAAETSELEEKYLQAADFAGQAARVWTSVKRFDEADRLLRYQMTLSLQGATGENVQLAYQVCGKAVVALVVIKLYLEDSVAAGKVYAEALEKYHFGETDDSSAVAGLLQAYDSFNSAASAELVRLPTFRNLENEFARLARSIKFPDNLDDQGDADKSCASAVGEKDQEEEEDIC
ncbi:unnamed protein product [Mesocestoides corti]|uniref:Gamma-soluble NSF attachment protein n=1 Tax=Mesocestoides corti TaxID=53468 RepID=A0A158QSJ7_MESCO|nr:unnamed protein product [Mesocestoides corti]